MSAVPRSASAAPAKIAGTVSRITFHSEETGFFVAKLEVPGQKHLQAVTGTAVTIDEGEFLTATGKWESSVWGRQFKATNVELTAPTGLEGVLKFLASSIPGIGPGSAKKLVKAFGTTVFDVIENEPERLSEVEGIGKKRITSIVEKYKEHQHLRRVMVFLHQHGLATIRAKKVYEALGDKTEERVRENPYILGQLVRGIGFALADRVAERLGMAYDAPYRVRAALHHALEQASMEGSCGLPFEQAIERASELLLRKCEDGSVQQVDQTAVEAMARSEAEKGGLIADTLGPDNCLFVPALYKAEFELAASLNTRLLHPRVAPLGAPVEDILMHAELQTGLTLASGQREAVQNSLASAVSVITGGPGVGKTQCTRVLISAFVDEGLKVALCAPTGKAARRATEATGFPAKTIHRTLEVNKGGFVYNRDNRLPVDVLIVDECSMVDIRLFRHFLSALPDKARLVLIGDVDQLPSVGPGKVLADLIESARIPVRRLTEIFRQAKTSRIVTNAHRINQGEAPEREAPAGSDFLWHVHKHRSVPPEELATRIVRTVRELYKLGFDPARDVQVLTPMRRGPLGVERFNELLAQALNPRPEARIDLAGQRYATGDKVMQVRNNYQRGSNGITNGEIGIITRLSTTEKQLHVQFDDEEVMYPFNELIDELVPAFAITIHKSQGSEFPVVVMPLESSHFVMLKRNLVYTGITRARQLCIVMGSDWAMERAVENSQVDTRYTKLRDFLCGQKPVVTTAVRGPSLSWV